jgi:alkylated DNA repair dioxygenase AlkB
MDSHDTIDLTGLEPEVLHLPEFVPDHLELFEHLRAQVEWDKRWHSRQTACFGVAYDYSDITYPAVPMPEALDDLARRIHLRVGLNSNSCLLNLYCDEHSRMGFHTDNEKPLVPGSSVAIVSLGSARTLQFRLKKHRSHVVPYRLESGSLLVMPMAVQRDWQHGVPAEPDAGDRISATYRQLREPEKETISD